MPHEQVSRTMRDVPTPPERHLLEILAQVIAAVEAMPSSETTRVREVTDAAKHWLKVYKPLLDGVQNDGPPQVIAHPQ